MSNHIDILNSHMVVSVQTACAIIGGDAERHSEAAGALQEDSMISIIYDGDGVAGVRFHETTYSPEALARIAGEAERYRAALQLLAEGHIFDAPLFAGAVLGGKPVQAAHEADVTNMGRPLDPDEQVAFAESLARFSARREVVVAALTLERREREGRTHHYPSVALPAWREAEQALYAACAAFREVGGSEVTG